MVYALPTRHSPRLRGRGPSCTHGAGDGPHGHPVPGGRVRRPLRRRAHLPRASSHDFDRLDSFWAGLWAEPVGASLPYSWLEQLRCLRPMPALRRLASEVLRAVGACKAAGADGRVAAWPDVLLEAFCACLALAGRCGRWPP